MVGKSISQEKSGIFAKNYAVVARISSANQWTPCGKNVLHIINKMYAIVEINGQQFKAEAGKKLFVNRLHDVEEGQAVEFDKVLLLDNEGTVKVGAPTVEGAKVVAEVVKPLVKGDKVIVFKMKRRKDYRKKKGHRQQYTQVEIKSINA
mgnify:FL=1